MSTQAPHQLAHPNHDSLWCPNCKEYGLVYCNHNDQDVWRCVYCDYQVNLTTGKHSGQAGPWRFPWEMVLATLSVLLFLFFAEEFGLRRPPAESSMIIRGIAIPEQIR